MKIHFRAIIGILLATVLGLCVLGVNLQLEPWIKAQYAQQNFDILNFFAAADEAKSLGYYLGKIEDVTVGPLSNWIMHLILAGLCLAFFPGIPCRRFASVIFLFLVISKFNVLFYPPYGDAIGGPFIEGWWLAEHGFDYAALFQQPGYNLGGPKVYMFSIYPTYLAVLLTLIPHVKCFLAVNHLLVFAMAAVVVALTREILRQDHRDKIATLTALVLLALPIFQSQTEAINMEMPYLFFSMLSVYALTQKKMGQALVLTLMAVLVKGHGILNCGIIFVFSMIFFLRGGDPAGQAGLKESRASTRRPWRYLAYALLAVMIALLKVGSKFLLHDQHASAGMIRLGIGWASLKHMRHPYIYLATFAGFLVFVFWKSRFHIKAGVEALFDTYYRPLVIYVSAGMWYALFFNFYAVSPRYMLGMTPFIILGIVYVFLMVFPFLKRVATVLLLLILSITALNAYGLSHRGQGTTYHVLSERSLQYRNDLELNMRLAQRLQRDYQDYTIGAPFITAQMLRIPELGFVTEPLDVMAYGMPIQYAGIKRFEGLQKISIMNTLWIGMPEQFKSKGDFSYPVHPQDKVIDKMVLGDNYAVLFMGGLSIDLAWKYLQYQQTQLKGGR
jgi:hypothetical protein